MKQTQNKQPKSLHLLVSEVAGSDKKAVPKPMYLTQVETQRISLAKNDVKNKEPNEKQDILIGEIGVRTKQYKDNNLGPLNVGRSNLPLHRIFSEHHSSCDSYSPQE